MARRILVLVAGIALLTGCTKPVSRAYTRHVAIRPPVVIVGAGFDVQTAGPVSQATSDATWAGVLATLNRYLDTAVLTPLRSGGPAGDVSPLFTSPTAGRVTTGPDRFAFVDEGLPPVADIQASMAVATLTALAGSDGVTSVVSAQIDLRLTAETDDDGEPVTVSHTGELVLLPDNGTWKIDAYDVQASRALGERQPLTTTTARS